MKRAKKVVATKNPHHKEVVKDLNVKHNEVEQRRSGRKRKKKEYFGDEEYDLVDKKMKDNVKMTINTTVVQPIGTQSTETEVLKEEQSIAENLPKESNGSDFKDMDVDISQPIVKRNEANNIKKMATKKNVRFDPSNNETPSTPVDSTVEKEAKGHHKTLLTKTTDLNPNESSSSSMAKDSIAITVLEDTNISSSSKIEIDKADEDQEEIIEDDDRDGYDSEWERNEERKLIDEVDEETLAKASKHIFSCTYCEYAADDLFGLRGHYNEKHPNDIITCQPCNQYFLSLKVNDLKDIGPILDDRLKEKFL